MRAAHDLFVDHGYGPTTIADIAAMAGVSVPTVYAGFPTKADLLRRAIETALAGDDAPIAVADRPTAQWVADTDDPRELLIRYATMCGELASRTGRIYAVLIAAADAEPSLVGLLATFESQRLTAARGIASAVRARGGMPSEASLDQARDVIWLCNSPELYNLAMKRRWSLNRYVAFVRDALLRLVLPASEGTG